MSDYKQKIAALEKHLGLKPEAEQSFTSRANEIKKKAKRNLDSIDMLHADLIEKGKKPDAGADKGQSTEVVPASKVSGTTELVSFTARPSGALAANGAPHPAPVSLSVHVGPFGWEAAGRLEPAKAQAQASVLWYFMAWLSGVGLGAAAAVVALRVLKQHTGG